MYLHKMLKLLSNNVFPAVKRVLRTQKTIHMVYTSRMINDIDDSHFTIEVTMELLR